MSNVLGVYRGARLYIAGYAKQSFFAFRRFSILAMFDCFATLYKSLSVWAEALKAYLLARGKVFELQVVICATWSSIVLTFSL